MFAKLMLAAMADTPAQRRHIQQWRTVPLSPKPASVVKAAPTSFSVVIQVGLDHFKAINDGTAFCLSRRATVFFLMLPISVVACVHQGRASRSQW